MPLWASIQPRRPFTERPLLPARRRSLRPRPTTAHVHGPDTDRCGKQWCGRTRQEVSTERDAQTHPRERTSVAYAFEVLLHRRRAAREAEGREAEQPAQGTPGAAFTPAGARSRRGRCVCPAGSSGAYPMLDCSRRGAAPGLLHRRQRLRGSHQ